MAGTAGAAEQRLRLGRDDGHRTGHYCDSDSPIGLTTHVTSRGRRFRRRQTTEDAIAERTMTPDQQKTSSSRCRNEQLDFRAGHKSPRGTATVTSS